MAKKKVQTEELPQEVELSEVQSEEVKMEEIEVKEEKVEAKVEPKVELPKVNVEELLMKYIDSQEGEEVELNEFFNKIHAKEDSYMAAKLAKELLTKLSIENKIKMSDTNWTELDMHYYEPNGKSKKYIISDIKILVKK